MTKVFIDGSAGTTGLRIRERLEDRNDIELIVLDDSLRKDPSARKEAIFESEIAFLCLPDAAAKEAVALAEGSDTVIIDTSTAHRTSDGWAYGFPELSGQREKIRSSKRIANPGCHASGFIALVAPLTECGVLDKNAALSAFSITGYSGGGKSMIADYGDPERKDALLAPRIYSLSQTHKHLPEMKKICSLERAPIFTPIVSSFYSGMEVVVDIFADGIKTDIEGIKKIYRDYYKNGLVNFADGDDENGFMSAGSMSGRDDMKVSVCGNEERITLISRFDNLGKGASGSAIQNMNIVLGIDERESLNFGE